MSISLNANFELLSAGLYLDARQQFNTIIEMKDFAETSIPDGLITYNKETQKHYVFNSSNTTDVTLGKWREYEGSNINIWQPNTEYKLNDLCLYKETNYYSVYICVTEHTSADAFVSAYWETIDGTEFEGYTEDELLDMLNLSEEELQNLQNIINDNEVQTDHVWSSSKVYAELLTTLSESKNFTIAEIAKIVSFSYKVVSSEDDVIDDKAIYLIENASGTHDMYLLVDGSPSKVGNTSVDLSDYLKKEDIIDTFDVTTTYTDSDKVFSTKASKSMYDDLNDKKISKSAIVTTLDDTVTDEQVPSALLTKTELDKTNAKLGDKASKEEIKNFKNVHISQTTLGMTIENGQDNTQKVFDALGVGERYQDCWSNSSSTSRWGIAESYGDIVQIEIVKVGLTYGVCTAMTNKGITLQRYIDTSMTRMPDWKELATMDKVWTKEITDVPNTLIVSENPKVELNVNCYYTVINGVCYVTLWGFTCTETGRYVINSSMPKTRLTMNGTCNYGINGNVGGCAYIHCDGVGNNKLYIEANTTESLYGSFSYPVASE